MKIVVVGLGYVGMSNAVLLAKRNEVIGVDLDNNKVQLVNARKSPIVDDELSQFLNKQDLNLIAQVDLRNAVSGADYVLVCVPTNYDETKNQFDTGSVEAIVKEVVQYEPKVSVVIKSTIPVGFTDYLIEKNPGAKIFFSPEFLREGRALHDNLYPSRIVIGSNCEPAKIFARLMTGASNLKDVNLILTNNREAEAIKLFSNTYLAMRVAFFNELDSYAMHNGLNSKDIISGVSFDPRIGANYNNPSFGYGGYCLPKDTKQLLFNYKGVPQNLMSAVVNANETRKDVISDAIMKDEPKTVGVFGLAMKQGSDNFRESAVHGIITRLDARGVKIIIFEPMILSKVYNEFEVEDDFNDFIQRSDCILTNRMDPILDIPGVKVFSRDIFGVD